MKKKKIKEPVIKKDFTEDDMPHNRFQAFFDIVKIRYDILLKIASLFFIFMLPIIITLFTKNVMLGKLDDALMNGEINEEAYRSSVLQLQFIFVFIEAFCILLISIPVSGVIRIYRLLTFYEGIVFLSDFYQGIKDNIKQVILVFLFDTVVFIISKLAINYLIFTNSNSFLSTIIFFLPAFLSIALILPLSILHIDQISIYNNKYFENIKNSFFLYIKSGLIILPLSIALIGPLFLLMIKVLYMPIIVMIFYAVIWLPLGILAIYLVGNSVFDKNINKEQYPSIYDKGVYRKK